MKYDLLKYKKKDAPGIISKLSTEVNEMSKGLFVPMARLTGVARSFQQQFLYIRLVKS